MQNDESKLKVTMEERIKAAMQRYMDNQAGRQRPSIRRKNNFIRGSVGIFCQHEGEAPPTDQSLEGHASVNRIGTHAQN